MGESFASSWTGSADLAEKINEWIISNIDIDNVLDRISIVGVEGLNKIEKKFLDNYKV